MKANSAQVIAEQMIEDGMSDSVIAEFLHADESAVSKLRTELHLGRCNCKSVLALMHKGLTVGEIAACMHCSYAEAHEAILLMWKGGRY